MSATATLRQAVAAPVACKVCGGGSALFAVADFNRSCEEARRRYTPLAGVAVYYRRCPVCGFIFTDAFDDWPAAAFQAFIYNDDYAKVDPDYAEARPDANARMLTQLFEADRGWLRVLDWGGGNGRLAARLREAGFAGADTYDPFFPAHANVPVGSYNVVACFETLEHLPDPCAGVAAIAALVSEPGAAVFSTLLQPADIDVQRGAWWYVAPRNGHVSLFSRDALARAWQAQGFTVASFNEVLHVAFRRPPAFLRVRVA